MSQVDTKNWDTDYEWKVLAVLAIGFGLVGLDRFIIATLWPTMSADLGLPIGMIGQLAGYTAMAWGVFSIIFGRLADRWGHRKIIFVSIILFSIMGGFTGMAQGLTFLVVVRVLMGVTEGAYTPTSFTAMAVASKPQRRGLNQGVQQCLVALMGLALGPIIATQMLAAGISWRTIFIVIAIPGFIVAAFAYFILKEPKDTQGAEALGVIVNDEKIGFIELVCSLFAPFKSYNIVVCSICLLCAMAGLFTMAAMVPVYLEVVIQLSVTDMGYVTSAIGFGGFAGQFIWPGLSDKIGRKPAAIIGFIGATIACWWFAQVEAGVMALSLPLFITSFFCLGNIALITGPIATESAPPGLVAGSIGLVVGVGEIFGGGGAPAIAGAVAASEAGMPAIMNVALIGVALGIVASLFLRETAPMKVGGVAHTAAGDEVESAIDESGPIA